MSKFRVTYEIVTPESAEDGDFADHGFIMPGEWYTSINDPKFMTEDFYMTLRDAVGLCYPQDDSGSWWSEIDGREDYKTGGEERRSLHPPDNITQSSYDRVTRLLGIRR